MGSTWFINEQVRMQGLYRELELAFKVEERGSQCRKLYVRLWQDGGVEVCPEAHPTAAQFSTNLAKEEAQCS